MKRRGIRIQHPVGGESLAQQSLANDADINTIVKRFMKTGTLPIRNGAYYADVSSNDILEMRNAVAGIDAHFMGLPAKIRRRFGGDPYQLVRWLENPDNKEEAIKLGLLVHVDGNPVKQEDMPLSGAAGEDFDAEDPFESEEETPAPKGPENGSKKRPEDPPKKGGKR